MNGHLRMVNSKAKDGHLCYSCVSCFHYNKDCCGSSKFYSKLQYVHSLDELRHFVPMDHVFVCDEIKQ